MECFALVYAGYEGLDLLALGNAEFVKSEYSRIRKEVENLHKKYNYDSCESYELPDEFYMSDYCQFTDLERLCIQGYKEDNTLGCVCSKFGIKISEPKYY